MTGRLTEIEVFAKVVQTGSFAAAAREMRLSPSAVSKMVARIEARLGLPLAIRSTRTLRLTPEGERFHAQGAQILRDIDTLERTVRESGGQVAGTLRVSCNLPFGLHRMAAVLPAFLQAYPGITLDFSMSDTQVDLIRDGYDVAIRTGLMGDSSIRARRLLSSQRHIVASPAYLEQRGIPARPHDLLVHECLTMGQNPGYAKWPFRVVLDGEVTQLEVVVKGRLLLDSGEALRVAALQGAGIARLSEFHVGEDIRAGRLVPLLPEFDAGEAEPIWIIYPDQSPLSPRIRAFIDFVARALHDAAA